MKKINIKALNAAGLSESIVNNKELIYPFLLYVAGLFAGSFLTTYSNPLTKMLQSAFTLQINGFTNLFFNRLCIYISVYAITVLLGLCIIGFPFINFIPLLLGVEIGVKTAFYYINYSFKGAGYSLLMIIPESAAYITVIFFTVSVCVRLSKSIFFAANKKDTDGEINLRPYLKSLLLYTLIVIIIALVNAGAIYILNTIITL